MLGRESLDGQASPVAPKIHTHSVNPKETGPLPLTPRFLLPIVPPEE